MKKLRKPAAPFMRSFIFPAARIPASHPKWTASWRSLMSSGLSPLGSGAPQDLRTLEEVARCVVKRKLSQVSSPCVGACCRAVPAQKAPHEWQPASPTGLCLLVIVEPLKAALLVALLLRRRLPLVLLGDGVFAGVADGSLRLLPAPVAHGRHRRRILRLWLVLLAASRRVDGDAVQDERDALASSEARSTADILPRLPVPCGQEAAIRGRRFGLHCAHLVCGRRI